MSRLTFIVPVFNPRLDILSKCIKSLVEQSLKSWDAVFVLDGPNQSAKDAIRSGMKKAPNQFKIVEQEHAGAQRARNHGADFAKGEFVVFWDYDCLIEPEASRVWVEMFDKYKDVAFVYSGYKFMDAQGAIQSEAFDPWMLRVRNYISTCFPVRREFYPGWNESLKSLQDWDFWLSVIEKGGTGKFLPGYAFSTLFPTAESISGRGCTRENWLERVDAVKKLHNIPERSVCVSSLTKKHEGIWLAKLIDADYQDYPTEKPHRYKTIIQVGFSFTPSMVEAHCSIFSGNDLKKILFWTCDDVAEVYTRLNLSALQKYSILLNGMKNLKQYAQDKSAADMLKRAGFNVGVRLLPMEIGTTRPLPKSPKFAIDIDGNYSPVFNILQKSLPDVELVPLTGAHKLEEFTGLCHFHPDRTLSPGMMRAVLAGRHVVSNVQAPFMGFVDDNKNLSEFIPEVVEKIRAISSLGEQKSGVSFYSKSVDPKIFAAEVVNAQSVICNPFV